jgi:hypothetical protein
MFECLIVAPTERIRPAELVERTWDGLRHSRLNHGGVSLGVIRAPYQEPRYSDRWYSGQQIPGQPLEPEVSDAEVVAEEARVKKETKNGQRRRG